MTRRLALTATLSVLTTACASSGPLGGGRLLGEPPTVLPPVAGPGPSFRADAPRASWGVGYLTLTGGAASMDLPLFDAPGGRHWGWLTQGRAVGFADRTAPPARNEARVRPPGEAPSYIVLDTARGGWMQIRWGGPQDPRGGTGWTRLRDARGGTARYTSWLDHLRGAGGLVYRNAASAHNLREGPGTEHAVVRRMEGRDFDLQALEIRGDWMRVRYSSPPACGPDAGRRSDASGLLGGPDGGEDLLGGAPSQGELLGGRPGQEAVGWIRWRSSERGPWVRRSRATCPASVS